MNVKYEIRNGVLYKITETALDIDNADHAKEYAKYMASRKRARAKK